MPCPRPRAALCQKTTCSHPALWLPETLIQASHTPLHSVLSSVSPPHYSSSIFKREYALLQLVCLEANLSRSLQGTASPRIFSFFFIFVGLPICLCLSTSAVFIETNLSLEDMEGGEQEGTFCIYIWDIWQKRKRKGWKTERYLADVSTQKWGQERRGK